MDQYNKRYDALKLAVEYYSKSKVSLFEVYNTAEQFLKFTENKPQIQLTDYSKTPIKFIEQITLNTFNSQQPFELRQYQKECIELFETHDFCVVSMPRQKGKSSMTMAYILWYSIYNENNISLIISMSFTHATVLIEMIRNFYDTLPNDMRIGIKNYSKNIIEFENGSKIIAKALDRHPMGEQKIDCIIIDEAAFISYKLLYEFWTNILPCNNKKIIVSSSPNPNEEGLFHQLLRNIEIYGKTIGKYVYKINT